MCKNCWILQGSFFGENPVLAGGSEEIRRDSSLFSDCVFCVADSDPDRSDDRKRTVTAVTECKLCFLVKEDLAELMDEYPAFEHRIKRFRALGKQHRKGQVSFQWKNSDFLVRNPDFMLRNPDFLLRNPDL